MTWLDYGACDLNVIRSKANRILVCFVVCFMCVSIKSGILLNELFPLLQKIKLAETVLAEYILRLKQLLEVRKYIFVKFTFIIPSFLVFLWPACFQTDFCPYDYACNLQYIAPVRAVKGKGKKAGKSLYIQRTFSVHSTRTFNFFAGTSTYFRKRNWFYH